MAIRPRLTLTVKGSAGQNLKDGLLEMGRLANQLDVTVEMEANDSVFWAAPGDTDSELANAYDRLYLNSRFIATHIHYNVPRRLPLEKHEMRGAAAKRAQTIFEQGRIQFITSDAGDRMVPIDVADLDAIADAGAYNALTDELRKLSGPE